MTIIRRPPKDGARKIYTNTLLVDGNSLFKVGYHGANEFNERGEAIGGIYQFITMLRKLLNESIYHKVYILWDGKLSGKLRYDIYSDYKKTRKNYESPDGSIEGTEKDPSFILQKFKLIEYLQELPIRQFNFEFIEGDDLIAYYCLRKDELEKITIVSGDGDMYQLITPDIRIYSCRPSIKNYIQYDNFNQYNSYLCDNAMLIKMITGDVSDNIKGVKGFGDTTLMNYFPELNERKVTLEELIEKAKILQEERVLNKKKPKKDLDNFINGVTTGVHNGKLYEINEKLVNLKKPLLTDKAKEKFDELIDCGIDLEGRDIKNLYTKMKEDGVDKLIKQTFMEYFLPFKKLVEREKKQLQEFNTENDDNDNNN